MAIPASKCFRLLDSVVIALLREEFLPVLGEFLFLCVFRDKCIEVAIPVFRTQYAPKSLRLFLSGAECSGYLYRD